MNPAMGLRRSGSVLIKDQKSEENRIIQESGLSKTQIDEIKEHLKKLETQKPSGSINKYELFDILKGYFIY
jgi:hypothetical protein